MNTGRTSGAWARFRLGAKGAAFLFSVLIVAIWIAYSLQFKQSHVISVATAGAEITFSRNLTSHWRVPRATLCARRENRLRTGAVEETVERACDPVLFEELDLSEVEITFAKDARLLFDATSETGTLDILFLADNAPGAVRVNDLTPRPGSILKVPADAWRAAGSFAFTGRIAIGEVASSGVGRIVLSGRYEIREPQVFGTSTVSVKSGDFFSGDRIRIVDDSGEASAEVTGFFISEDKVMRFQVVSPLGRNHLRVDRLGSAPSIISSNVIDRSLSDPWLLFLSLLPAIALTVLQLFAAIAPGRREP